ncbi:uncharacterized protein J3D65DRAFT_672449 [Phyllosticta citribraziliensis]|uniref:Uncharacterized protein n=1 Tax=Phyllosticta citribraziliensis TaxID=989973 RepID=A0ABR1L2P7_9PEZI
MLLYKSQPIPIRERQDCLKLPTSTKIYSLARSCITSKSPSGLVREPCKHPRSPSLGRGDHNSTDDSSTISSTSRTSLDSAYYGPLSSNTSIAECPISGSDKIITQRIEAEVDRISTDIAQCNFMEDGLRQQHWNASLDNLAATEQDATLPMPHVQDISLALTDSHVLGDPIFMSSAGFEVGPAGLQIGHCSYLNLPAGECCSMRIIGPTCVEDRPRFQLVMTTTVMDVRTTNRHWKLCLIYDVTEAINELATARLTGSLEMQFKSAQGYNQLDVAVECLGETRSPDEPFDWNAFIEDDLTAQDVQSPASRSGKEAQIAPESLDVPADIARFIQSASLMRSRAKKFFILTPRPLEHRKRSLAQVFRRKKSIWAIEIANLSVSFVSSELLQETEVLDRLASHLRRCTAESVIKCFDDGEGFEWRATLRPGIETAINCFPIDNGRVAMAREVWWVCFVEI